MTTTFARIALHAWRPALAALLVAGSAWPDAASAADLQQAPQTQPTRQAQQTQQAGRIRIEKQADLPSFSYPVAGSATRLVESDDATFAPFAAQVRADVERVLASYDIEDRATLRRLLGVKLDLQELAGEYAAALKTIEAMRALEDKPSSRLLSGLYPRSRLQAALAAGRHAGSDYERAFAKEYRAALAPLPWDLTGDRMKASYGYTRLFSRAATLGYVKTDLDPAVARSGWVDAGEAWQIVAARNELLSSLPVSLLRGEALHDYIAAHQIVAPDIWAAREVTLTAADALTPVAVAVWDSGIDVSLFPSQLFTDAKPTASGAHGLAFDDFGNPSTDWLYPLSAAERKAYPNFRAQTQGFLDLQNGIDSAEATETQKLFRTLDVEQMHDLLELDKVFGFYVHGTHCAGIAVRGNPAARLVVARFDDQLPDMPFAPTEAWARKMGAAFQQMADYFRTRNVRVVNMSWGDDAQEFETWLSKTGGGADPEARKAQATALFAIWRDAIEAALRSAPGTLFVVAAGNSDSNVGFIEDVPASLRLPNLIGVGAVNQAGEETSFTSHGDAVLVHANGYEVDSVVPGGAHLRLSGTSMAAPNVVNLAAKLFALDPGLTPERAIALIRDGATTSADGRRHLVDAKRSVALLKAKSP